MTEPRKLPKVAVEPKIMCDGELVVEHVDLASPTFTTRIAIRGTEIFLTAKEMGALAGYLASPILTLSGAEIVSKGD